MEFEIDIIWKDKDAYSKEERGVELKLSDYAIRTATFVRVDCFVPSSLDEVDITYIFVNGDRWTVPYQLDYVLDVYRAAKRKHDEEYLTLVKSISRNIYG